MSSRLLSVAAVGVVGLFIASACGSSDETSPDGSSNGGFGSSSSSSGSIGSSGTSGNVDDLAACATETLKGEALPLDIHIMLDVSGSMNDEVSPGVTKFKAVKDALKGFVNDPSSSGIAVGLQVFPITHAGAPATCTQDSDCTAGGFGSCSFKSCEWLNNGLAYQMSCVTNADCPGGAACRTLLAWSKKVGPTIQTGRCLQGSTTDPFACPSGATTQQFTTSTCSKTECFTEDYDDARVAMAALPGNASAITSSIDAIPTPPPTALTPTSAALTGGLTYAKQYAAANPSHAVVVVLATDGFPTRCPPYDSGSIGNIAKGVLQGTPSVKTFVVGVFTPAEKTAAQTNLDDVAKGGGTNKALIVTTGANVASDFQAAMNEIRGQALPCDYKVPSPQSGTPDFGRVNVKFTDGAGKASVFPQAKGGASSCDAGGGWYYDVDPSTGGTPTKITLCPASCNAVKTSGGGSKVDVLLGCTTIVK